MASRSPSVKRITQEMKEMQKELDEADGTAQFAAQALESDIFEWHFAIRGPDGTEFEHGIYHGRILLPHDYPFKPPSFIMLTPSGRFETNTKICLSISSYHPEQWQPSWSMRTALTALIAFFPTPGNGAVGSMQTSPDLRRVMARDSREAPPKEGSAERREVMQRLHALLLKTPVGASTPPPLPEGATTDRQPQPQSPAAASSRSEAADGGDDREHAATDQASAASPAPAAPGPAHAPSQLRQVASGANAHAPQAGAAVSDASHDAHASSSNQLRCHESGSTAKGAVPAIQDVHTAVPPVDNAESTAAVGGDLAPMSAQRASTTYAASSSATPACHRQIADQATSGRSGATAVHTHSSSTHSNVSAWGWRRLMRTEASLRRWRVVCDGLYGVEVLSLVLLAVHMLYPLF